MNFSRVLVICLAILPAKLFAYSTGIEYSKGTITVKPKVEEEIQKKGTSTLIRLFSHVYFGRLELATGLGLQTSEVKGEDLESGIRQVYTLKAPTIDFSAHYRIWYALYGGILLRNQFGKGASYGIADEEKIVYVLSVGPSLIYRPKLGKMTFTVGVNQMQNQPTTERTTTTTNFSVGLSYSFSGNAGPK